MNKIIVIAIITYIICGLAAPTLAQQAGYLFGEYDSGAWSVYDRHFGGVLFPEVYKGLSSTKVAYPGLWIADRGEAAVGFIPGEAGKLGWNALYASADIDLSPGSAGLWIGNVNSNSSFWIFEYNGDVIGWEVNEFSLRGAFWASPFQNERFRGVSAAFDVDNFYASNGNDYEGTHDNKRYYLNVNALVKLGDAHTLKASLYTRNKHSDNPADSRVANRRLFTDALSVGLVDAKLRAVELRAQNTFAMNNADELSDTASLSLRYTAGGAKSYMRHILYVGVRAEGGVYLPSRINQDAGSFQYIHYLERLTGEGSTLHAAVNVPVAADIDLFRGLRCMLSISPRARYTRVAAIKNPWERFGDPEMYLYRYPMHDFALEMPNAELTVRGRLGERFDFAVAPSVKSEVFFSVLEVRYRF